MEKKVLQSIKWDEALETIRNSSQTSSIYIGCDSLQRKKHTSFAIALVIHIDSSKGGKLFVERIVTPRIKSLKQRLMKEVEFVAEAALKVAEVVGNRKFEVHIDVNPDPIHKSNEAMSSAVGWIKGLGFEYQIKPNAFAATYAADKNVVD